jgi:hypothetical protein
VMYIASFTKSLSWLIICCDKSIIKSHTSVCKPPKSLQSLKLP